MFIGNKDGIGYNTIPDTKTLSCFIMIRKCLENIFVSQVLLGSVIILILKHPIQYNGSFCFLPRTVSKGFLEEAAGVTERCSR